MRLSERQRQTGCSQSAFAVERQLMSKADIRCLSLAIAWSTSEADVGHLTLLERLLVGAANGSSRPVADFWGLGSKPQSCRWLPARRQISAQACQVPRSTRSCSRASSVSNHAVVPTSGWPRCRRLPTRQCDHVGFATAREVTCSASARRRAAPSSNRTAGKPRRRSFRGTRVRHPGRPVGPGPRRWTPRPGPRQQGA